MALVIELAGSERVLVTVRLPMLALVIVELVMVVVAKVVVAEKVLSPVQVLLPARAATPETEAEVSPVIVALVRLREEETVSAPMVEVLLIMPPQAEKRPPTTSNLESLEVALAPITMA